VGEDHGGSITPGVIEANALTVDFGEWHLNLPSRRGEPRLYPPRSQPCPAASAQRLAPVGFFAQLGLEHLAAGIAGQRLIAQGDVLRHLEVGEVLTRADAGERLKEAVAEVAEAAGVGKRDLYAAAIARRSRPPKA